MRPPPIIIIVHICSLAWNTYSETYRGVRKCLLGIFCRECVWDAFSSVTFLIFFATCRVVCVQLAHSSLGDRQDIFIAPIIIIFYHCCRIFSWWCAWGGCTIIYCRFHVYPSQPRVLCFFHYSAIIWCEQMFEYIMTPFSYISLCLLHYLSIIVMQTYLMVLNF